MHSLDRVLRAPLRPIAIGIRIEIRFKDWFQQQLGGSLYHPIPNGRDSEGPLATPGLRNQHPSHRLRLIRLRAKLVPNTVQPFLQPLRFDTPEALPIYSWCALIELHQLVGMGQNVFSVHLVVEQIETVVRLFLRFLVQLLLKHPDFNRCFQAHRQSPLLSFFQSTSEVRVLPSAGITRPQRSYGPLRLPGWPSSL